jgi:hypothetical protein
VPWPGRARLARAPRASGAHPLAEEERRALQSLVRLVQDAGERLEHVRHVGGDVQDDVHPGRPRTRGEAGGVVQQDLVRAHLDQQGRKAGQVGEDGRAEQGLAGVGSGEVHGPGVLDGLAGEDRVDAFLGVHALARAGGVEARGERHEGGGQGQAGVTGGEAGGDGEAASGGVAGEHDGRGVRAGVQEGAVGAQGVLDRGREGVLGGEPVVRRVRPEAGPGHQVAGQRQGGLGGAEHEAAAVEVQDRPGAAPVVRLDVQCGPVAERRPRGADAAGHDHPGHQRLESGSDRLDRPGALRPRLPHHRVDLGALFLAHESAPAVSRFRYTICRGI